MPNPIYEAALRNIVAIEDNRQITVIDWIKRQIKLSKSGFIKIEAADMKNALGPEFVSKKDSTIYEALRYVMAKYKIKVRCNNRKGNLILIMGDSQPIRHPKLQ